MLARPPWSMAATKQLTVSVQWDGDFSIPDDVIICLHDTAREIDIDCAMALTGHSLQIIGPIDGHGGVRLLDQVMCACMGVLDEAQPDMHMYGMQYFELQPCERPREVAARGSRRRQVNFLVEDVAPMVGPSAGSSIDPSAGSSARLTPTTDTTIAPLVAPSAGSSARVTPTTDIDTPTAPLVETFAGSSSTMDTGISSLPVVEGHPRPSRAPPVPTPQPPPPATPPPSKSTTQGAGSSAPSKSTTQGAGSSALVSYVDMVRRRAGSVPPPPRQLPYANLEPIAICRLIQQAPSVRFMGSRILGNRADNCTYFQWRATQVLGIPLLDGCQIDMHVTLMYMHIEPCWNEVLVGMQEQWRSYLRSSLDHTESSWILSEYSDENRGMLKLIVGSRLYAALLASVSNGVRKLPVPSQPDKWRFRHEFHLSVLSRHR